MAFKHLKLCVAFLLFATKLAWTAPIVEDASSFFVPPTPPKPSATYTVFNRGDNVSLPSSLNQSIGCFRIPSLVRTQKGTLLAFAEARVNGCRPDVGFNRPLVVRSSTDDGATWGEIRVVVAANETYGTNYPAATILEDGTV